MTRQESSEPAEPGATGDKALSLRTVALGAAIGLVLNVALTCAALKLGLVFAAAALPAVMALGVSAGIRRAGGLLSDPRVASVVVCLAAASGGTAFAYPALYLLGGDTHPVLGALACVLGGLVAVVIVVPQPPRAGDAPASARSGQDVASVPPGAFATGRGGIWMLLAGAAASAGICWLTVAQTLGWPGFADLGLEGLTNREVDLRAWLRLPDSVPFVLAMSPLALGFGFLAGGRGLMVLAGGALAGLVITPLIHAAGWTPLEAVREVYNRCADVQLYEEMPWHAAEPPDFVVRLDEAPDPQDLELFACHVFGRVTAVDVERRVVWARTPGDRPVTFEAIEDCAIIGTDGSRLGLGQVQVGDAIRAYVEVWPRINVRSKLAVWCRTKVGTPIGMGMLAGGALVAVLSALRRALRAARSPDQARGLSFLAAGASAWSVFAAFGVVLVVFFLIARVAQCGALWRCALTAVVGTAWLWATLMAVVSAAGRTAGRGIDGAALPSGIALLSIAILLVVGGGSAAPAAVLIATAISVAAAQAGASKLLAPMNGAALGGWPAGRWLSRLCFVVGPAISLTAILLLAAWNVYELDIPVGEGTSAPAPQAQVAEVIVAAVQGQERAFGRCAAGAVLGALLSLTGWTGLGVLLGVSMVLPFGLALALGLGALCRVGTDALMGGPWTRRRALPFAVGLLVGEPLVLMWVALQTALG